MRTGDLRLNIRIRIETIQRDKFQDNRLSIDARSVSGQSAMEARADELSQVPNVRSLRLLKQMQVLPAFEMCVDCLVARPHLHVAALTFTRVEVESRRLPTVTVPVLRSGWPGKEENQWVPDWGADAPLLLAAESLMQGAPAITLPRDEQSLIETLHQLVAFRQNTTQNDCLLKTKSMIADASYGPRQVAFRMAWNTSELAHPPRHLGAAAATSTRLALQMPSIVVSRTSPGHTFHPKSAARDMLILLKTFGCGHSPLVGPRVLANKAAGQIQLYAHRLSTLTGWDPTLTLDPNYFRHNELLWFAGSERTRQLHSG
jgi:hypothetical protein